MAASTAIIGYSTSFTFSGFTAEIISLDGFSLARDAVERTHMESPEQWREYMPGLKDAGELSLEIAFDPGETPLIAGTTGTGTVTWPDSSTWACSMFLTAFSPTAPIDDRMTASVTFKLTGEPTFDPA